MVEEVQSLMEQGISAETLCYYGLEYRYITLYLTGNLTYEQMVERLGIAIHQFAKRQMTWFRGMARRGAVIHTIDGCLALEEKVKRIMQLI
jgi:tRNA dimethylallyltransferase